MRQLNPMHDAGRGLKLRSGRSRFFYSATPDGAVICALLYSQNCGIIKSEGRMQTSEQSEVCLHFGRTSNHAGKRRSR